MDALFLSCDEPHVARLAIGASSTVTPSPAGTCKVCPAASVRFALSPSSMVRVPDVGGGVVAGAVTVTVISCSSLPASFVAVTVMVADPTLTPVMVRVPPDSLTVATAVSLDDAVKLRPVPVNTVLRVIVEVAS